MKKLIMSLIAIVFATGIFAQAPEKMGYQSIIRNSSNTLVTNSLVGMKISILQTTSTGTAVYVETQQDSTNENGLITIEIGAGTTVSGTFSAIDWSNGPFFIKIEIDPAGGTSYTNTSTAQLLSVPYALYAKTSGSSTAASSYTHYIGELYGGGIIVNLYKKNGVEHGLIMSLSDIDSNGVGYQWSNITNKLFGASSLTNGQSNTTVIKNANASSAAARCMNYNGGGHDDWYLPSILELVECLNVNFTITNILGSRSLRNGEYWSSTEYSLDYVSSGTVNTSSINSNERIMLLSIRAVRKF